MYIDITIIYSILLSLGAVVVGYLIYTLININKLIANVNSILTYNSKTINESIENLPSIIKNVEEISSNAKDITDVATDITADVIVAKENLKSNADLAKDVVGIVKNVFLSK